MKIHTRGFWRVLTSNLKSKFKNVEIQDSEINMADKNRKKQTELKKNQYQGDFLDGANFNSKQSRKNFSSRKNRGRGSNKKAKS